MRFFKKKVILAEDEVGLYEVTYDVYLRESGYMEFEHCVTLTDTLPEAIKIAELHQHRGAVTIKESLRRTVRRYEQTRAEPLA